MIAINQLQVKPKIPIFVYDQKMIGALDIAVPINRLNEENISDKTEIIMAIGEPIFLIS